MKIVKVDSFRSQGTKVNQTYDMARITIDCSKRELFKLKILLEKEFNQEQKVVLNPCNDKRLIKEKPAWPKGYLLTLKDEINVDKI
jgi:DNA-directed RNA polymerase subunit RPC12/RpoP